MTPGTGHRAEPIFHLCYDKTAELLIGQLLRAQYGDRDQGFSGGSVGRSDLIHYHEIVDGSGAITVQDQHGMRDRRFVGGIVEAGDAARSGLGFANKVRGGGALGGDHHGARGQNGIAFAEHFKDKFEHAIGGFQFAIEKNSAEKWTKKAMDEFFGETRGYQGIFRGALRALEDLLDSGSAQAGTQAQDA